MSQNAYERKKTAHAALTPTTRHLEWAAGYLEGEGCFCLRFHKNKRRKPTFDVTAGSTDIEPIQTLLALFGGSMRLRKKYAKQKRDGLWCWNVNGVRALGVAQTLYPLLSPRRQAAIRRGLAAQRVAYAR